MTKRCFDSIVVNLFFLTMVSFIGWMGYGFCGVLQEIWSRGMR